MKNEKDDFVSKWQGWYPDCPPLGSRMFDAFTNRWCRIDNLPGDRDQRPQTPEQRRIVLERHVAISTEVLGADNPCAAIMAIPRQTSEWSKCPWMAKLGASVVDGWIETWSDHPMFGEEAERVKLAVARCDWSADLFSELILDVAENRNWTEVVFVALDTGRAYSPCEYAADVFVENQRAAHALWEKYLAAGWTPPGLYTGEPTEIEFPAGFPYGWRTLPWK